ncbi:unnamed protein product, partial [Bubo scandiacus]
MNFLLTWIHWGLAALLYLQSAELSKAAPALGDGERKPNEVIKFLEVYERSFCRTIETLVDIFQEYPDEVEYIFKPSCVPLMRCAGCCGDEGLECVPVDVYNVTMEIMRIKPHQSQHIAHMSFLQHSKCDCRPKKDVKNKQEKKSKRGKGKGQKRKRKKGRYKPPSFHCEPCSERRKHLFVQDPQTCKCSCKFTDSRCKSRQLELNERTCRCEKPRRWLWKVMKTASLSSVDLHCLYVTWEMFTSHQIEKIETGSKNLPKPALSEIPGALEAVQHFSFILQGGYSWAVTSSEENDRSL